MHYYEMHRNTRVTLVNSRLYKVYAALSSLRYN